MKRFFIISFLAAFLLPVAAIGMNEKPFVVPELRSWKGAEGSFMPTELTISVPTQDEEAARIANAFAEDYNTMFGKKPFLWGSLTHAAGRTPVMSGWRLGIMGMPIPRPWSRKATS